MCHPEHLGDQLGELKRWSDLSLGAGGGVASIFLLVHPASWHTGWLPAALRLFQKRLLVFLENFARGKILLLFILQLRYNFHVIKLSHFTHRLLFWGEVYGAV